VTTPATAGPPPRPPARSWPIAAAMLPFPAVDRDGVVAHDAPPEHWARTFARVAAAGFDTVDVTDSWLRPGDLDARRLTDLGAAANSAGLHVEAISAIRRSVIDPETGPENLAYSHRTLEAAAALGCSTVSIGLHRPLTPAQREALWFWTVDGPRDAPADRPVAVSRIRELGEHAAGLGLLLSLEMYEDTLLGTAESAVRLVHEVGLENVGLNPDLGNLVRLHRPIEPIAEMVAACVPVANYWHVKNYVRMEDHPSGTVLSAPTSMELGVIDYRDAVHLALRSGFTGAFCVEQYGGDGLGVMSTNARYLRGLLLEAERCLEANR
jgi:sugar phosphate isomerase/epimerase